MHSLFNLLLNLLTLLLQIMIGNAEYHCSCVQYASEDITELIIGVVVAAVVLLLIIVIIVVSVIVLRDRQLRKRTGVGSGHNEHVSMNEYDDGADEQNTSHSGDHNTGDSHAHLSPYLPATP